ncbi:MAG: acyltransferase, partial [Acidimicrobiales bacterium]|nr:acyltransferase [Acidimicrobiales bacterium]
MGTAAAPRERAGAVDGATAVVDPDPVVEHAPPPAAAAAAPGPQALGYLPGLDGLRAIALLAVLAFHHGFGSARGGYLGVSSFFTLSGFLITTLAIGERARTGRLSWPRFWERRARRLLPAALVTLAGVLALHAWFEVGSGSGLRGDVLAALGYVANWRLALGQDSYADLFAEPSPVVHFWSLAIEEQFYLAFPLVFGGVMTIVRGARRRAATVFGLAAAASFAVAAVVAGRSGNDGIAYYGTHTRAGELLVGVVLAFVLASPTVRRAGTATRRSVGLAAAGAAALAVLAWLWSTVAIDDTRLFRGVTLVNAVLTAVVITAVTRSSGFDRVVGIGPLRAVGKVSYAAYLFHWPLFLLLAPPRVDLAPRPLFAVRLGATLVAAGVSYVLVESPFRFRLELPRVRLAAIAAAGVAAVVALAFVVRPHPTGFTEQPVAGGAGGGQFVSEAPTVAAVAPPDGVAATHTALVLGDSVAYSLLSGFHFWNVDEPDHVFRVDSHIAFGCPVGGPGVIRGITEEHHTYSDCAVWRDNIPRAIAGSSPDVIVILMGLGDLNGREVDGEWREMGDPTHDDWLMTQIDEVATALEAPGTPVVWLTFPHVRARDTSDPTSSWQSNPINDPAKVERYNELVAEVMMGHHGIDVVDL